MLLYVALVLTATSLGLHGAMMGLFALAMRRRARGASESHPAAAPRVSILKPLAGEDDDLAENLESFARLAYPEFEILFGVASKADPAFSLASCFVARHPELDARVVLTAPDAAVNPKVAQLVGLESVATGEICVISDSNVRVSPAYLWSLVQGLGDATVGMVTSLFVGTGEKTLGAAIENLQLCASSAPGLVAMNAVAARPITVGKSMAMRRCDLARLGGFVRVGGVLAEDHALGRLVLDAGFSIMTSLDIVENRNLTGSLRRTIERHTRWSKTRRTLQPLGFFGEPLLMPIAISGLCFLLAPGPVMGVLFGISSVAQIGGAIYAVRVLRGRALRWWHAPLELVRTVVVLVCWAGGAFGGGRIEWRGHHFKVKRGSVIVPVEGRSIRARAQARERLAA
ncbi:MAG: glycosyltransferase [Polyangiaceae bacterium]|jgi:ceramide glucosyltransferase